MFSKHPLITISLILSLFTQHWDRTLFWLLLNTVALNSIAVAHHNRISDSLFGRIALTFFNVVTLSKFVFYLFSTEYKSFIYNFHFIQAFILTSIDSTEILKAIYDRMKKLLSGLSQPSCVKLLFALLAAYIIIFSSITTSMTTEECHFSPRISEFFWHCQPNSENAVKCSIIKDKYSYLNIFLMIGAFFWMLSALENTSWILSLFLRLNVRPTSIQKRFSLSGWISRLFLLLYSTYQCISLVNDVLKGELSLCNTFPTSTLLYTYTILIILVLEIVEVYKLMPITVTGQFTGFWSKAKNYASTLVQKLATLILDEEDLKKLHQEKLQEMVDPLIGFNSQQAPQMLINEEICSNCLEPLTDPNHSLVYWRECIHLYHEECINELIKNCPLCRRPK